MRKIFGLLLISIGITLVISAVIAYMSWATAVPVVVIGGAIIMILIGIYLRSGDE